MNGSDSGFRISRLNDSFLLGRWLGLFWAIPLSPFLADVLNALALHPFAQRLDINALLPSLVQGCSILARSSDNILPVRVRSDEVFDIGLENTLGVRFAFDPSCTSKLLEFLRLGLSRLDELVY